MYPVGSSFVQVIVLIGGGVDPGFPVAAAFTPRVELSCEISYMCVLIPK